MSFPLTRISSGMLVIVAVVALLLLRSRVKRAARAARLNRDLVT